MNVDSQNYPLFEACTTPCYLFDEAELRRCARDIRKALASDMRLCYAMKANTFVLETAARESDYVEACSPGELEICHTLGVPDEKIVVSGVNKGYSTMAELASHHPGIHRYTIESATQYDLLESCACAWDRDITVLLRMTSGNQFGMDAEELVRVARMAGHSSFVNVAGIQYYSGTQKRSAERIRREVDMLDGLISTLEAECGIRVRELEYGPGLPVGYAPDNSGARECEKALLKVLGLALSGMSFRGTKTIELGRALAARCGAYVTSVVDIKRNDGYNYAVVDGGRHQINYYDPALALKSPAFSVLPGHDLTHDRAFLGQWTICGSLCSSGDILVREASVDELRIGDRLVFPNAGAYCMTEGMSLFLSRDLPQIYLHDGADKVRVVRTRMETSSLNTPCEA